MPLNAIDYTNTIIYKIVCKDLNISDVYVGHTTSFKDRKGKHKYDCINNNSKNYNHKIYKIIRENGNWENWDMIEIEKYPCNDLQEARARERYWYEIMVSKMNSYCPFISTEEKKQRNRNNSKNYYADNREKCKEEARIYHKLNRDKIIQKSKELFTCECGKSIQKQQKTKHLKTVFHQKNTD